MERFSRRSQCGYLPSVTAKQTVSSDVNKWLEGVATYSGTTLSINADKVSGSGTFSSWNFNISGIADVAIGYLGVNKPGVLQGLTLSNNATDAANDIDIAAGSAFSDDSDPYLMVLATGITKRADANWAAGTNQGGLDTGTFNTSVSNYGTAYSFWLIANPTSGVVDVLMSADATNPTMPSGFTKKKYIGSVTATSSWRAFKQIGNEFRYVSKAVNINDAALGTTSTAYALPIPLGRRVLVKLAGRTFNASTSGNVYVRSDFETDQAASITTAPYVALGHGVTNSSVGGQFECWSTEARGIYAVAAAASTTFQATVLGYVDPWI